MKKFNLKCAPAIISISIALSSFAGFGVSAFSADGLDLLGPQEVVLPEEIASEVGEGKTLSVQLFDGGAAALKSRDEGSENINSSDLEPGGQGLATKASRTSALVTKLDRSVGIAIQEKREEEARKAEEARRAAEEARKAEEARRAAEEARKARETRRPVAVSKKAEEPKKSDNKPARSRSRSVSSNPAPASNSCAGQAAFNAASSCIGLTYGTSKGGISLDCSGLVVYAYRQAGINLPHSAKAQYGTCRKISADSLQIGDLVFWASGSNVNHVGIYAGNGNVLESSVPGKPIAIRKIWSSSRQKVIGYGRP